MGRGEERRIGRERMAGDMGGERKCRGELYGERVRDWEERKWKDG